MMFIMQKNIALPSEYNSFNKKHTLSYEWLYFQLLGNKS